MTDLFPDELAHSLGLEGGYSNNANDRGGATKFGITEAYARSKGYTGAMEDLTLETITPWYREDYWDKSLCGPISQIAPLVAGELFDTGINCGTGNAGMFLQRALNCFSNEQRDYAHVVADGAVGPGTLAALTTYINKRGKAGEMVLLKAMNCLQGEYYIRIAGNRIQDEDFEYGWFNQRIAL